MDRFSTGPLGFFNLPYRRLYARFPWALGNAIPHFNVIHKIETKPAAYVKFVIKFVGLTKLWIIKGLFDVRNYICQR